MDPLKDGVVVYGGPKMLSGEYDDLEFIKKKTMGLIWIDSYENTLTI